MDSIQPKFRGFCLETKDWHYGCGWFAVDYTEEYMKEKGIDQQAMLYTEGYPVECSLSSMGQYTGKKDEYDNEIYAGDVVNCKTPDGNKYEKRVICWDTYQTRFKSVPLSSYHSNAGNGGWTGYDLHRTHCEVLGSVYLNPELI